MNKRLEEIKEDVFKCNHGSTRGYSYEQLYSIALNLVRIHGEWLVEQAEREFYHSNKINKLHFFLDNNVADLASERCGHHVIDVAIYVIKKQAERVQELEDANKNNYWVAVEKKWVND